MKSAFIVLLSCSTAAFAGPVIPGVRDGEVLQVMPTPPPFPPMPTVPPVPPMPTIPPTVAPTVPVVPMCNYTCSNGGAAGLTTSCPASYTWTGGAVVSVPVGTQLFCQNAVLSGTNSTALFLTCGAAEAAMTGVTTAFTCLPIANDNGVLFSALPPGQQDAFLKAYVDNAFAVITDTVALTSWLVANKLFIASSFDPAYCRAQCRQCNAQPGGPTCSKCYGCTGAPVARSGSAARQQGVVGNGQAGVVAVVCPFVSAQDQLACFEQAVCRGLLPAATATCTVVGVPQPCPACNTNTNGSSSKKGLLGLLGLLLLIPLVLLLLACCIAVCLILGKRRKAKKAKSAESVAWFPASLAGTELAACQPAPVPEMTSWEAPLPTAPFQTPAGNAFAVP